ncbi:YHYH domain-containing protein [Lysinibacillus sp. Ag94]|uniref:YHYH domain-containing protein n=1 Tax=Lysinibacillus sp. Ag94 TaxID=2936682 RepID=UPI00200D1640|nr:YHYH domain-containing protein [Lysinibacillus sp. Ag94]UPW83253.1 YHYH domain-containing protein [Lysinibacillus sp. Ag94]
MRSGYLSKISVLVCSFLLLLPFTASAHPGRTDSNGGHTCRTNCEKWGLQYGEYHYHNGGSTSNGSSSISKPAPKKPVPSTPEPKIDEDQVKAENYYTMATNLYNSKDYKGAISELEKIYELNKGSSKTDSLIQKSVNAIYELAESKANAGEYSVAKDYAVYIKENRRSNDEIKQKASGLLKQMKDNEKIDELLYKATNARDKKDYEETFSIIQEAQKIKQLDKIKSFYTETVESLTSDAEEAFYQKQYGDAKKLYKLLVKKTETPTVISQYQKKLQRLEGEQLLQKSFHIKTADFEGKSLFNHLMEDEKNTPYDKNVVNILKDSLHVGTDNAKKYIFTIKIEELLKGGKKDGA